MAVATLMCLRNTSYTLLEPFPQSEDETEIIHKLLDSYNRTP